MIFHLLLKKKKKKMFFFSDIIKQVGTRPRPEVGTPLYRVGHVSG